MTSRRRVLSFVTIGVALTVGAISTCQSQSLRARFDREIPWHDKGVWLKADTHVHTRFSDGAHTVEEVIAKAESFGCQVIAITDHIDSDLKAATPEYFAAIDASRLAHPGLVILAGVEWNLPPWNGDEHATILVDPSVERRLAEFKNQFDDLHRPTHDAQLAAAGLRWLAANATGNGIPPVVIYQHPSRRDLHSMDNVADILAWRKINDLVIGFAGAPGHQGNREIGSYDHQEKTIDRWDPVVARVGDAWDTLLGQGLTVWAADAPSDFHNADASDLNDFWPGQFSEEWLYAPTRDAAGVLKAFRAGSYFGDHGRFVRNVELQVTTAGLSRPATAGEVILAAAKAEVRVEVYLDVPPTAWPEGANHVDLVELIGIDATGAKVVASSKPPATGPALSFTTQIPAGGIVFRARGYRDLANGTRLAFYTNPVRVKITP